MSMLRALNRRHHLVPDPTLNPCCAACLLASSTLSTLYAVKEVSSCCSNHFIMWSSCTLGGGPGCTISTGSLFMKRRRFYLRIFLSTVNSLMACLNDPRPAATQAKASSRFVVCCGRG